MVSPTKNSDLSVSEIPVIFTARMTPFPIPIKTCIILIIVVHGSIGACFFVIQPVIISTLKIFQEIPKHTHNL